MYNLTMAPAITAGILLFERFELLDVFGPAEAYGSSNLEGAFKLITVAEQAGPVRSGQGLSAVADYALDAAPQLDLILVPGGIGTRREVANQRLLEWLNRRAVLAALITSGTGAALLARAGLLDGKRATTNKRAFAWVASQGPKVNWIKRARWVEDGKFATSSGVSASIDMALALIARLVNQAAAERVAATMEYEWHRDPSWDPFAELAGLG